MKLADVGEGKTIWDKFKNWITLIINDGVMSP